MRGLYVALPCLLGVLCPLPGPARAKPPAARPALAPPAEVCLCAVGDLLFGRYVPQKAGGALYSPVARAADPFTDVAPILRQADLAFGNLETPVMREPRRLTVNQVYTFRADPDKAGTLARAGFDVLSLANNHITNLGPDGARATRNYVLAYGMRAVGAGAGPDEAFRPVLVEVHGLRVAFLAYTLWNGDHPSITQSGAVAYLGDRELLEWAPAAIQLARQDLRADWVIVSLHWGLEDAPHPRMSQKRAAHALIDAGADVVLGHHPHVLQDFERYHGGLIAYSLGNFLFDNPALAKRQTVILQLTLSGRGGLRQLRDVRLTPVLSGAADYVPHPAQGADYRALALRLADLAPGVQLTPDPAPPSLLTATATAASLPR